MDSLNIDKFNYKIKANILFDDESLKLSDIGLSWLHCEEKKLIVKTVNKNNDKYTISFKRNNVAPLQNLIQDNDVHIGCIFENNFKKIKLTNIKPKEGKEENKSLNLILNNQFNIDDTSDISANLSIEESVNIDFNSWSNFDDNKKRIESLATKSRIENLAQDEEDKQTAKFKSKEEFLEWYKKQPKKCCYCGVKEEYLKKYFNQENEQYKEARQRGQYLEIERIVTAPKTKNIYSKENCALVCYICNNAKSDFLSPINFKPIAKGINEFWKKILKKSDLKYKKIVFPEKSKIWDKK